MLGGGIGVILYYAILYLLTEFADVWYVISAIIAFTVSNGINFIVQKLWTFKNRDAEAAKKQYILYLSMGVCLLVANTLLLYVLVEYGHLNYLIAQAILTVLVTIVNFAATKRIFKN
jgi:dolichol-phosphate mannosyltransferase